jgi:hypothetical protein
LLILDCRFALDDPAFTPCRSRHNCWHACAHGA